MFAAELSRRGGTGLDATGLDATGPGRMAPPPV